jgi:hypothetical protein
VSVRLKLKCRFSVGIAGIAGLLLLHSLVFTREEAQAFSHNSKEGESLMKER